MRGSLRFAVGAGVVAVAALGLAPAAGARATTAGALYAQTNDAHGNRVLVYSRWPDGTLHAAGSWATRGRGGSESGAVVDPLASQSSVAYDSAHHLLFVTNA